MLTLIRLILTTILLVIVWHHSHWSVALSLTLLYCAGELQAAAGRQASRRIDENPVIKRYMEEHRRRHAEDV